MSEDQKSVLFMVEGGLALELVKQHIAERRRVREQVRALAAELGVERVQLSRLDGTMYGAHFTGAVPAGWTKPNKHGASRPKIGNPWRKRLAEQVGYEAPEAVISKAFGVPLNLEYRNAECVGYRHIGQMLTACGWLYPSAEGPYAMWVPNVPAEVAKSEAEGFTVSEPAKSFRLELDGCRRIEPEEWDIVVAQHKLKMKQGATP